MRGDGRTGGWLVLALCGRFERSSMVDIGLPSRGLRVRVPLLALLSRVEKSRSSQVVHTHQIAGSNPASQPFPGVPGFRRGIEEELASRAWNRPYTGQQSSCQQQRSLRGRLAARSQVRRHRSPASGEEVAVPPWVSSRPCNPEVKATRPRQARHRGADGDLVPTPPGARGGDVPGESYDASDAGFDSRHLHFHVPEK